MTEDRKGRLPAGETVLVAAFEGWNDAGSAATQALAYLDEVWDAEALTELDPEDYHDFQVNRPVVSTTEDGERLITWPTTTLTVATAPLSGRTIALVHGIEPSIHWRRYCAELLDIAEDLSAQWLITVGALLADVPHTRPIPVTVSCEDPDLAQTLDVSRGRYEGPTGIVGILQHQAQAHGLAALSVWAAVPHYVAHPPSPKATLALLHRLEQLLDEPIPLGDLPEEAAAWQTGVDELAAEDSDIAEYVHQLEQAKDTADLPEATGEAIAQEFERYLRRRDGGATS